jgi:PKD domain
VGEPDVSFRATGSTDPDDDIASWSIDFGDGTSTGGNWTTEPPAEVTHDYGQLGCVCTVVLAVTDFAGHSSSDQMLVDLDNDGLD